MQKILIIGWPVRPAQEWLKEYSQVSAYRIYREKNITCPKKV